MKAVYISYDGALDPLGASQVIPYLIGLSKKGIDFNLLTYEKKERLKDKYKIRRLRDLLSQHRIKWTYYIYHKSPTVPATAYDIVHGFLYLCRVTLFKKVELIHARSFVGAIPALLAAKILKVKFLYDNRGFYPEERVDGNIWKKDGALFKIAKYFEKKFWQHADVTVCLTGRAKEIMLADPIFKNRTDKIEIIPTCVDTRRFKLDNKNSVLLNKFNLKGRFVFIYCGSIGTWYMLDEMLDFFIAAKAINPKVFFLILTSFYEEVKQKILQKGLNLGDFLVAYVDYSEIHRWFTLADAGISFIVPAYSKKSSCPTKFGEMLSCGIPLVINAGIGDTDTFVSKYELGIVLENPEGEAFSDAAKRILEMAGGDKAPLIRERCRKFAERFFSVDMAVNRYFLIYEKQAVGRVR